MNRQLSTVAAECGERALGVRADVTDPASVRAAVARVEQALGPIDVLVNNAGWDKDRAVP